MAVRHVTVVGDERGHIRVWRDGAVSDLDLGGRQDAALSGALSPDEKRLAIGTSRGRILVFAL